MKEVNETIIPSLGLDLGKEKITENTARHWLVKLGYEMKECCKGVYVDGHKREDVVAYRKEFLLQVTDGERSVFFTAEKIRTYWPEQQVPSVIH